MTDKNLHSNPRPPLAFGFTLVEVLVYMAIFGIMAGGITTLVLQVQRSNITVQNYSTDSSDAELALRSVQLKMGRAEAVLIDNVTTGDQACIRLKRKFHKTVTGFTFDGDNQYLKSSSTFSITGATQRTTSVWVWYEPEIAGHSTVFQWGTGAAARTTFGLQIDDGKVLVDMGCHKYRTTAQPLEAKKWYHIAVTYNGDDLNFNAGAVKIFINGNQTTTQNIPVASCSGFGSKLNTSISYLYAGNQSDNRDAVFKGKISKLMVWNAVLSPQELSSLYKKPEESLSVLPSHRMLFWPMDLDTGAIVQNIGALPAHGMKNNFPPSVSATFRTAKEIGKYEGFCFYDDDNNGLHSIWHSEQADSIPATGGTPGWKRISKEIFVPSTAGFFQSVGDSANSLSVNFAVGKATLGGAVTLQKGRSVNLSLNRRVALSSICRIGAPTTLAASGCGFNAAYVSIAKGFDNRSDRLDYKKTIGASGWTSDQTFILTSNDIQALGTAVVNAKWHKDIGILSFRTGGEELEVQSWRSIFDHINLETRGTDFIIDKTIRYSLGGLAYVDNGTAHFHDFVPMGTAYETWVNGIITGYSDFPFADAMTAASTPTTKFCGLQPYLSTITSKEEDEVFQNMARVRDTPAIGGWIGAKYFHSHNQLWSWIAGPDNGTHIWQSYAQFGRPFYENGLTEPTPSKYFAYGYDHLTNVASNEYKRVIKPKLAAKKFRYQNFSYGNQLTYCSGAVCEPFPQVNDSYLAFQDSTNGAYLWHAADSGNARCDQTPGAKICGYYQEFGGMPGDPTNITLFEDVEVNLQQHRAVCQPEG